MWQIDPDTLKDLAAGGSGSVIAAWLSKTSGMQFIAMAIFGLLTAHFIGPYLASRFGLVEHMSAVGFMVGFLALLLLNKLFEVINSVPGESIGVAIGAWLKKKLGVNEPPRS